MPLDGKTPLKEKSLVHSCTAVSLAMSGPSLQLVIFLHQKISLKSNMENGPIDVHNRK